MDNPPLPQLTIPTNGDSSKGVVVAAQGQVQPKNEVGLNGGLIFFFFLFILIWCILFTLLLLRKYKPMTAYLSAINRDGTTTGIYYCLQQQQIKDMKSI